MIADQGSLEGDWRVVAALRERRGVAHRRGAAERPHVQPALDLADPRARLAGFVAVAIDINRRTADVYQTLLAAASANAEAGELLTDPSGQRQRGQGLVVDSLESSGPPPLGERAGCQGPHLRVVVAGAVLVVRP